MKALITDYVHSHLIEGLESQGYTVTYDKDIQLEEVKNIINEFHGIVINSKTIMNKEMMDRATNLKWIARLGSGLDIIDLPYAASKDITVYNSPEGNRNAVAEHAMGMLLSLLNQLKDSDSDVRSMDWQRELRRGTELMGKTVGIVGFGNTGSALATKLSGFGVRILVYDKYKPILDPAYHFVESVSLEKIQKSADIISFHIQLTDETRYLVEDTFLENCKNGVILINTSRGKVINVKELLTYLQNGKVGGACLDVFPNEKTKTFSEEENKMYSSLYTLKNTVLSPHIAGWTHESLHRIADVLLMKIGGTEA